MGKQLGGLFIFLATVMGLAGGIALGFIVSDVLHDNVEPRVLTTFRPDFGAQAYVDMPPIDGQALGGGFEVWYSLREGGLAVSSAGGSGAPQYEMNYREMGYEPDLVAIAREFNVMPETIIDRTREMQRPQDIEDLERITIPGAARYDADMLGMEDAHFRGRLAEVSGMWRWWGVTDTHLVLATSEQPWTTTFETWPLDDAASVRAITAVRAPEGSVPANDDVWLLYDDGRVLMLNDRQPTRTLTLPEGVTELDGWAAMPGDGLLMVAEGSVWHLGTDSDIWQALPSPDDAGGDARWLGHVIGREVSWAHIGYDEAFWRITPDGEAIDRTPYAEIGIVNPVAVAEFQANADDPDNRFVYVAGDGQVMRRRMGDNEGEWSHWFDYEGEVLDFAVVTGPITSLALDGDGPNARFASLVAIMVGAFAVFGFTWGAYAIAVRVVRRLRDDCEPIQRESLLGIGATFAVPLFGLTLLGFIIAFGTEAGNRVADLMRWYSTQGIVLYPNAHDDFITFWWTLLFIGGIILYVLPGVLVMYRATPPEDRPAARRRLLTGGVFGVFVLLWILFEWLAADFGGVWEIVDTLYFPVAILFLFFLGVKSQLEADASAKPDETDEAETAMHMSR